MSTKTEVLYTPGAAVSINMHGLQDQAKAISDAIDNSTTRFQQANIGFKFKTNQHRIDKVNGFVVVGILRSCDQGVTYDTFLRPGNILQIINDLDPDTEYHLSVNTAHLGFLPDFFKISIRNSTGQPFFHKEEKFGVWFTGMNNLAVDSSASMAFAMNGEWLR